MLKCSTCGVEKPEEAFKRKHEVARGYTYQCKECIAASKKRTRQRLKAEFIGPPRPRGAVRKYATEEERKAAAKISRKNSKQKAREKKRLEREAAGIFLSNKKLTPEERLESNRRKKARRRARRITAGLLVPRGGPWTAEQKREYKKAYKKTPKGAAARKVEKRNRRATKKNVGGRHTAADIKRIHTAQKYKCAICKCSTKDKCEVDHIMPLALGGSNDPLNLQILCPSCNNRKNAKHPVDYMQSLGLLL
jgi:5-methylcytosine-specific restriction endonuclease McrA